MDVKDDRCVMNGQTALPLTARLLHCARRIMASVRRKQWAVAWSWRPELENHVSTTTLRFSAAMVFAISVFLITGRPTIAGGKDKKLSPAVGKIELKDGKGEIKGKLADNDPKDASRTEMFCKIY